MLLCGLVSRGAIAQDHCGPVERPPGPLVAPTWLKQHLGDSGLVVLDAERSRAPYDSAHIAGARLIAVSDYTAERGGLLYELPPLPHLDSVFQALGLGERGRIVLYGDLLAVTRLFFTLDYAGLGDRVSVLDGGLPAWRSAGGTVTALPTPASAPGRLTLRAQPGTLADQDWIRTHLADSAITLLDARTSEEFDGSQLEAAVARPGHIPGAKNLNWSETLRDGRFREPAELRRLLAEAGVKPGTEVVTYCRVGSRASVLYFVGRVLGMRVRLYDGSMNEWAREMPVEKRQP